MNQTTLTDIAKSLADGLKGSLCSDEPQLFPQLLRLLADGNPVPLEKLAANLKISVIELKASLRQMTNVEFDSHGNIIGSGLTFTATPHSFQVNDQSLFTWCAFDTLFFPSILQQPAQVTSVCPTTQTEIRLTVTPEGIETIEPGNAVVSIIAPDISEPCCDVRSAFCDEVHFFSTPDAASNWVTEHDQGIILPVNEAFDLGQILSEILFDKNISI